MPEKQLTSVQRYVLLTLMITRSPLPNKNVSNSLKAAYREDLRKSGYIEVSGKPMTIELTQKGHDRAVAELDGEQPSGSIGMALSAALGFIRDLIKQTGTKPEDLFRFRLAGQVAAIPARDADLEERIRKAYFSLIPRPGDHLMLEDLRSALPDVNRQTLDTALIKLNGSPDIHLIPESNQKLLTEAQRAAAVRIGNQFKHVLAIGS